VRRALRILRSDGGGAAIEFAIISSLFIFGCIATLEFGRALYVRGEMTYAADVAERAILMDPGASESDIQAAVMSSFRGDHDLLTIALGEETVNGIEFRTLALDYPLSLILPYFSINEIGLTVDRRTPLR
jgi:hypothetical protein